MEQYYLNGVTFRRSRWPVSLLSGGVDSYIEVKGRIYLWLYRLVGERDGKFYGFIYLPDLDEETVIEKILSKFL